MFYNKNLYYLLCSHTGSIFGQILVPELTGQNSLRQSDCRIFKSTISSEQIDKTASFFACWYKFTKNKLLEKDLVGHGQNWSDG